MKKMMFLFVLLISLVAFNHTVANAETQSVAFNKNISDSFKEKNQINTYSFTTKKAGKIKAAVISYNSTLKFSLYDDDFKVISTMNNFSSATKTNGQTKVTSVYLEAGTYTVQVSNPASLNGDYLLDGYSFKVDFTDSKTTEIEPNNTIDTAQSLVLDSSKYIIGQLSWNNQSDYYKVTLKKSGYVWFTVSSNVEDLAIKLLDRSGDVISNQDGTGLASENTGEVLSVGEYVEKGIYYLKATTPKEYRSVEGIYKVKVNLNPANNKEKEPNNSFEKAEKITVNKGARTGLISWNDSYDYYKFIVPKKTAVNISMWSYFRGLDASLYNSKFEQVDSVFYFPSNAEVQKFNYTLSKGTYYLKFYSTNSSGKYGFSTFVNVDPSLKLNAVDNKYKKITGKTEANAKVRIYVNNKLVKTIQTTSKGTYSYKHKALKARNKVKVISTNKEGGKTTKQVLVRGV